MRRMEGEELDNEGGDNCHALGSLSPGLPSGFGSVPADPVSAAEPLRERSAQGAGQALEQHFPGGKAHPAFTHSTVHFVIRCASGPGRLLPSRLIQ